MFSDEDNGIYVGKCPKANNGNQAECGATKSDSVQMQKAQLASGKNDECNEKNNEQAECCTKDDSSTEQLMSDANGNQSSEGSSKSWKPILEQDRFLPIANISRLMKNVIPRSGKVAKDAKECVQECVSEFISFITSEACDRCAGEKRKTITGEDIIGAFVTLGFDNYVEPLSAYVKKIREAYRSERSNESLIVESSGSQISFMERMNAHDSAESASASHAFSAQNESIQSTSACSSQIVFSGEEDADGSLRVLNTGNVQHLQLLMDPTTGQHYINVQTPNGTQQLLPVQISTVADPGAAAPMAIDCADTQNHSSVDKSSEKELPNFSTSTEYQPSVSKSGSSVSFKEMSESLSSTSYKELPGNMPSTSYKELTTMTKQAPHVVQQSEENSRNDTNYGVSIKRGTAGRSAANHQKHQIPYGGAGAGDVEQFGQHHSVGTREQPRKRSHDNAEYYQRLHS